MFCISFSCLLLLILIPHYFLLTAYLVSFLNLLNRVQSCNDNHLLLGANCVEDHPLMKAYTELLTKEMEELEKKTCKTPRGHSVKFKFKLIPADMKWISTFSGELNNAATYFSPFANVSQSNKSTIGGSIGGTDATWQPWNYQDRLKTVKKVENFKNRLRDPSGKERGKVTKYIAQNKSRQEFSPSLGKYVDNIKPDPLHNTNNAWQQWFMTMLAVAMQYTEDNLLKAATMLSEMPSSSVVVKFLHCIKDGLKCARLFKNFVRWFSEKRKKAMPFTYRFTGLESKNFSWNFALLARNF